jgi:hypothetical protein
LLYGLIIAAFVLFCIAYLYSSAVVALADQTMLGLRRFGVILWSVPFDDMVLEEDPGPIGGLLVRQISTGQAREIPMSVFPRSLAAAIRAQMQLSLSRQQA